MIASSDTSIVRRLCLCYLPHRDRGAEAPPADISVMLTVKNVSKVFDTLDNGVQSVRALDDVSLDVKEENFSIIGPSGCGKSTLIRIIAGLVPTYDGEVRIGTERVLRLIRGSGWSSRKNRLFRGGRR